MGQSKALPNGPQVFHVNFHTARNRAVFEAPEYRGLLERTLLETLDRWALPWLAWQVMPTHIHVIVISFPDFPLSRIVQLLKGSTARAILRDAPELRADMGDHLWQEGYDWVEVTSQRQCALAVRYVNENRIRGGLD